MPINAGRAHIEKKTNGNIDWGSSESPLGYALDEVMSALIKEIRRSSAGAAVYWAHEMMTSGKIAECFMWKWLGIFAVEDMHDSAAATYVESVRSMCFSREFVMTTKQRHILAACVVIHLAEAHKNREATNFYQQVLEEKDAGTRLEMPDYALDMHTQRGRKMGRNMEHYRREGARIINPQ